MSDSRSVSFQEQTVRILRRTRYLAYAFYSPLERVLLRVSGISGFPPIHLRRFVGAVATPEGSSMHYAMILKLVTHLKSDCRILDLGCGCGLLELALEDYLSKGHAIGVDIHRPCIEWAAKHISRRSPNISFRHADIYNPAYWPSGVLSVEQFFANLDEWGFDTIVAKSLFTHMLIDELPVYLREIGRRLRPQGNGLLSFFLLNEDQHRLQKEGKNKIEFHRPAGGPPYAFRRIAAPSAAVAYDEGVLHQMLAQSGLRCTSTFYGAWSGRSDALDFQDILVVEKEPEISKQNFDRDG